MYKRELILRLCWLYCNRHPRLQSQLKCKVWYTAYWAHKHFAKHAHTPKYFECTAVCISSTGFMHIGCFSSIIWWSWEAAEAPTTKQKVINHCGKTMEHLCSQVCRPYLCARNGMLTYVFIRSAGFVCVNASVCVCAYMCVCLSPSLHDKEILM